MVQRIIALVLLAVLCCGSAASQSADQGQFDLKFDDHGITSLKFNGDKFDTDYIADEATLGNVNIRYKMGENEWRQFSTRDAGNKLVRLREDRSPRVTQQLAVVYNPQDWRKNEYYADLELTERFRAERDALYQTIAGDPLPHRPNRSEPRAIKRRPKNFRLMTRPRHQMRVEPSRKQSQKPSKPCLN